MIRLIDTEDGSHSLYSEQFNVTYHSKFGAIQETRHVFINAGLHHKAEGKKELSVLDIGFGTGLNAFMTLLEGEKLDLKINYTGVEAFPIGVEMAQKFNYADLLECPDKAETFLQLHQSNWGEEVKYTEHFTGTKLNVKFQELDFDNKFDVIYFDAFAPQSQPELWTTEVFGIMKKSLVLNGVLVTYCAKGDVKRILKGLGFEIEKLLGPPGKREMTRATKKD